MVAVFDYLKSNGIEWKLDAEYGVDVMADAERIYKRIWNAVSAIMKEKNSLGFKIKKSFGFLFTGEDLTETLAKSRPIAERMLDAVELIKKQESDPAEALKKMTGGVFKFGKK